MNQAPPSIDPANQDSLIGIMRAAFAKLMQDTDDMLPAKVVSFDRGANRAQVQPLIRVVSTSGETIPRAQIASLPVLQVGGGGMVMLYNLKPGDLGWIKANDRDVSLFLQSYSESPPNTFRKHSFSDAIFVPDVMRGWALNGEDAENAVLQTLDGNTRIALWPSKVKISAGATTNAVIQPASIVLTVGAVSMTVSAEGVSIIGNLSVTGAISQVNGGPQAGESASFNGDVSVFGTLENNGVNVGSTHRHNTPSGMSEGPQ